MSYELTRKLKLMKRNSLGATTKYLTKTIISDLQMLCPSSVDEQVVIAEIIGKIDDKLITEKSKANNYLTLFSSILDQLMTGKIRVENLNIGSMYL